MVVTNFQLRNAGLLPQPGLQLGQNALGVVADGAQLIHLGMVALGDDAAIFQRRRCFRVHCGINLVFDVGQRVDLSGQFCQLRAVAAFGLTAQPRQTLAGLRHGEDLLRGGGTVDRAGHHALQIEDVVQLLDEVAALDGLVHEALHRVQAAVDEGAGHQRLFDPAAKHPLAHGGAGLVQHPEQGAPLFAAAQGLGQLQIGPRDRRQAHELRFVVAEDRLQALHALDLGGVEVFQQCRHGEADIALFADAGLGGPIAAELVFQRNGHKAGGIVFFLHKFNGAAHILLQVIGQLPAVEAAGIHQHFAGVVAAQLGDDGGNDLFPLEFRDVGRAGGDIGKAEARLITLDENARNVVVFVVLKHTALNDGARRDHTDDIPLDKTLCLGRVLHLLADGDLVALGDEPGHIAFVAVEGHAAHGGPLFQPALLAGQRQIQLPRGGQRIIEEHLVKVADAVEQDLVLVLIFDFQILLHHGRQFGHGSPPFLHSVVVGVCSE